MAAKTLNALFKRVQEINGRHRNVRVYWIERAIKQATGENFTFLTNLKKLHQTLIRLKELDFERKNKQAFILEGLAIAQIVAVAIPILLAAGESMLYAYRWVFNIPINEDAHKEFLNLLKVSAKVTDIPIQINKSVTTFIRALDRLDPEEVDETVVKIRKLLMDMEKQTASGSRLHKRFSYVNETISDEAKRLGRPRDPLMG